MALLIKTDNTTEEVQPRRGREFTARELQNHIGGFIEVVRLPNNHILVINGEGPVLDLPLNFGATVAAQREVVGHALLCKRSEARICWRPFVSRC